MENNKENNGFSYSYSASQQAEVRKIREKYAQKATEEEDKMARLRRLDASVTQTAQTVALIFGVLGTLILGLGMSLIMTDLAESLGWQAGTAMVIGVVIGVIGGALACLAYPVYNVTLKAKRKKLSSEILRLTDELMK